jgi:SAM-dependent methyltransferase
LFALRARSRRPVDVRDGFLYEDLYTGEGSVYDTVLRYTTQKHVLALGLAERIHELGKPLQALDIGTSKGNQLAMTLGQLLELGYFNSIHHTLVEPDESSVRKLRHYADAITAVSRHKFTFTVKKSTWEDFIPQKYDLITATHMIYHLPLDQFGPLFAKMTGALTPGGRLLIAARERENNEVFELIQFYKARMPGETFNEVTMEHASPYLEELVQADPTLSMKQTQHQASVVLPFESNLPAAQKLMAFFLQRPSWTSLPTAVQRDILHHSEGKDIELGQRDRLIEINKAPAIL